MRSDFSNKTHNSEKDELESRLLKKILTNAFTFSVRLAIGGDLSTERAGAESG